MKERERFNRSHNQPFMPLAALTEQWLHAMQAWTNAWLSLIPGACPPSNRPGYGLPTIAVRVYAVQPVEVTASLKEGAECIELVSDTLYADDGSGLKIDAQHLSIKQVDANVRITLELDKPISPKRYTGAIRSKADGSRAGALTVITRDPDQ